MMLTPANTSPEAEAVSGKQHVGIIGNEGGFILALAMFMLAICMILGTAAMNTSVNETDITTNEVVVKQVYTLAESGLSLAAIPVLTTQGRGSWNTGSTSAPVPFYLDDTNPLNLVSSGAGAIQIWDGQFLFEGREDDQVYDTGPNNADKYLSAVAGLDSAHQAAYKPNDDPFQKRKADGTLYDTSIINTPDIRIRTTDPKTGQSALVIDIDVDKAGVKYLAGGVAEFGSGADGSAGASVKIIYLMDCKAVQPGKDITSSSSPTTEVLLGYRFVPDAGI